MAKHVAFRVLLLGRKERWSAILSSVPKALTAYAEKPVFLMTIPCRSFLEGFVHLHDQEFEMVYLHRQPEWSIQGLAAELTSLAQHMRLNRGRPPLYLPPQDVWVDSLSQVFTNVYEVPVSQHDPQQYFKDQLDARRRSHLRLV